MAGRVGGVLGSALAGGARLAFVSGMDLALTVGAVVVGVSAIVVLVLLPNRARTEGVVTSAEATTRAVRARATTPDACSRSA